MQWLHFCDFHVGRKRGPIKESLNAQLSAVKKFSEAESWEIDAVFLVGDIAFSGAKEEYESFKTHFLDPLKNLPALAKAIIFVVPGNHDISCDDTIPTTWEIIGDRRDHFFCEDSDGLKARKVRALGFESYSQFVKDNSLIGPDPLIEVSTFHSIKEFPFYLLATNTAFFSDKTEDSSLPKTPIPLASLRDRLASAPKDKPILIIGHHSMLSFRREQETQFTKLLRENNAIYLHGHEHITQSQFTPEGMLRSLGFGASHLEPLSGHNDPTYKHTFTHCHLSDRLYVRSFTWESGEFIDTSNVQFSELLNVNNQNGIPAKAANIPLISDGALMVTRTAIISKVSRISASHPNLFLLAHPIRMHGSKF